MAKQTFTTGQVLTAAQMTSLQQTAMGGGAATAKTTSYVLTAADAGTVVQMNAAGATTITVNTALFAAGDSVQIQNIGAGVCTVTAGTATVTTAGSLALSQWEGGNLYFTSTSASIFFDIVQSSGMTNPMTTTGDTIYSSSGSTPARLGIGTTGQVLTVAGGIPSWATSSAGALTKITSASFSAVTDTGTTFDGVFSSTYNNYLLEFSPITGSVDGADFRFQFRKSGPTTQAASYYGARINNVTATTFSNATSFPITLCFGESSAITMNFYREGTPQQFSYSGFQRSGVTSVTGGGFNDSLAANTATGFILSASSGTVSGTVAVYGLAD